MLRALLATYGEGSGAADVPTAASAAELEALRVLPARDAQAGPHSRRC